MQPNRLAIRAWPAVVRRRGESEVVRGSRSRVCCRPLTVSVTLAFCTDAVSALVSVSTGGEASAKVAAPEVARKRRRDKRKRTPATALPPTEIRPRRGTSTISYPPPENDLRMIVVGAWSCANFRQNAEPPGFRWRLVLQRRIDAFDQRRSVERIVCALACRQNTVASIPREIPSLSLMAPQAASIL
jgi:hypothetical protein